MYREFMRLDYICMYAYLLYSVCYVCMYVCTAYIHIWKFICMFVCLWVFSLHTYVLYMCKHMHLYVRSNTKLLQRYMLKLINPYTIHKVLTSFIVSFLWLGVYILKILCLFQLSSFWLTFVACLLQDKILTSFSYMNNYIDIICWCEFACFHTWCNV